MKLRSQHLSLVVGLTIPFLLFVAVLAVLLIRREQAAVERGLRDTAYALASAFDREIAASIHTLDVLAASHDLKTGNVAAFHADLIGISAERSHWHLIALADAAGRLLVSTLGPGEDSSVLPAVAGTEWFERLRRTDAPVVSSTMVGGQDGARHGIPVAVPVHQDGALAYVVVALYDIRQLNRLFDEQQFDRTWTGAVVDRSDTIIARSRSADRFVGQSPTAELLAAVAASDSGRFVARTLEGVEAIGFFTHSPLSGWLVMLSAPEDSLLAPMRRLAWMLGGGGALLLAVALGVAALFARRISRAMRSLADAARALGRGAPLPAMPPLAVAELRDLAGEMARASELLEQQRRERDAAEERLKRSESLHRGVIELVQEIIWIHQDGKFVFANPFAARMMGLKSPAEFIGKPRESFLHPEDAALAAQRTGRVLASGDALPPAEFRLLRPDGGVVHCEMQAIFFDYEGRPAVLAIGRDITQRRQAAEALRQSEARFRDFAEVASDWLWEMGPDLRFTYLSPRIEELTGIPPTHFVGKTREEMADPGGDAAALRAHLEDLRARRPFRNFAYTWTSPDGQQRHARISGRPLFDDAGTFQGYRGIGTDVTAELEAEARLRQAQKMEAVGQLTGGVAHDFNNLLIVVIGNAELLLDRLDPHDRALRALVGQIEQAGVKGAALTQRLLAFSRRQALKPQIVDVNRLVREMVPLLRRTLGETIEIQTMLPDGIWTTLVDASQTESALLNLAVNARDAMPEGGRIIIETANARLDEDYAARVGDVRPGAYAMLAVSDSGTGMAPEVRDRAFEPFFTTKEVGKGSGLGLSMVYGFVKQSGGHVALYSEVGIGTTVKLYLPRAETAGRDADDEGPPARPGSGETILLVEDDPEVRTVVAKMLKDNGYAVVQAADGKAALDLLQRGTAVDLVLTDVVMPGGIGGWDLAQTLWRDRPDLRILFMTGYTDNVILQRANKDSRIRVLSKPFRQRDLAAAVRGVLEREPPA